MTRPRRHQVAAFLFGVILVALAIQNMGCGASSRQRMLKGTLVSVDAARDGFLVWDEKTQDAIVRAAASRDAGAAMLAAHREKRTPVVHGLESVYRALALAALDPEDANVALVAALTLDLYQAIEQLTGRAAPP